MPGAAAGADRLTSYPVGANMATMAGREAGLPGTPPRPVRLPPGYAIDQGTDRGLLLAPVSQQPGEADKLWDPSAQKDSPVFDGVLATGPGEIARTSQCATAACVRVLNLATGRRSEVAVPAGSSAVSGSFSPDGIFLALQLSVGSPADGGELGMRLTSSPCPAAG